MSFESNRNEHDDLSQAERILRDQDRWDEIARSPQDVEITAEQLAEVERRLRNHELNPGTYSTWEEIKQRLEKLR